MIKAILLSQALLQSFRCSRMLLNGYQAGCRCGFVPCFTSSGKLTERSTSGKELRKINALCKAEITGDMSETLPLSPCQLVALFIGFGFKMGLPAQAPTNVPLPDSS
jgi:hypothetical protein